MPVEESKPRGYNHPYEMNVQEIIDQVDSIAPPWLADEGDPIGLQTGRRNSPVSRVLVCVDVTPSVVEQAVGIGAEMIVSHHALIYSPLRSLERSSARMDAIAKLVAEDIAVYVAHTNYDSAPSGMNDVLAELLGVTITDSLSIRRTDPYLKLAVFVPVEALDAVRGALSTAGAGVIGNYSECDFTTRGKGHFRPLQGAEPYTGSIGKLEEVEEHKLEMILPQSLLSQAIDAMLSAHPYEEVAYDVYRLENRSITYGLGRVGTLEQPMELDKFAEIVEERLGVQGLRMVGDPSRLVKRVALCAGGGDFLIEHAHNAGADVYVTGTASYHRLLDADALGLAFIDAGHFETERPGMKDMAQRLDREMAENAVEVKYVE